MACRCESFPVLDGIGSEVFLPVRTQAALSTPSSIRNGVSPFPSSGMPSATAPFTTKELRMMQFLPKRPQDCSSSAVPELLGLVSHLRKASPQLFDAAVLPEQFYNAPEWAYRGSGAAALMRAVLDDAIHCFQQYSGVTSARARRLAQEAEDWLFSDEEEWPFSFVNICFVLGLDPAALRHKLRESRCSSSRSRHRKRYVATRRRHLGTLARAA